MLRVLCVDDHPLARAGLIGMINQEEDMTIVGDAETAAEGIALFRALRPDVVIMDIYLPGMSGLDAMTRILTIDPRARVIMVTAYDEPDLRDMALRNGAVAFILKDVAPANLAVAVRGACM